MYILYGNLEHKKIISWINQKLNTKPQDHETVLDLGPKFVCRVKLEILKAQGILMFAKTCLPTIPLTWNLWQIKN